MPAFAFNHAMIYTRDVSASLGFYRDLLGFELLEEFRAEFGAVYARLKAPQGDSTIALHPLEPGTPMPPGAWRVEF